MLDAQAFLAARGRLPRADEDPPAWRYFGHLLPYVIGLHEVVPATGNRWGYHLRQLAAGELLGEPIPPIDFDDAVDAGVQRHLVELLRIAGGGGGWNALRDLVDWLAFALRISRDEPRLDDETQERLYRTCNLTGMLERPHDHLGHLIQETRGGGWNPAGFYATPHSLAELIARMTLLGGGDGRDLRSATVHDPAVGTGRLLLHASNHSLRLSGQDIDGLMVRCCLINGALYAPWMSFPLPESYFAGREDMEVQPLPAAALPEADPAPAPTGGRFDERGQGKLFE